MPPTTKNTMAATPYMMPSFLWSTVNTHDAPAGGRDRALNTPSEVVGVTMRRRRAGRGGGDRTFDDGHVRQLLPRELTPAQVHGWARKGGGHALLVASTQPKVPHRSMGHPEPGSAIRVRPSSLWATRLTLVTGAAATIVTARRHLVR